MRSLLEARWAMFMDCLKIDYLYEPEVFNTRHGWYLPDFYLPAAGVWVEIKPSLPSPAEREKAAHVSMLAGQPAIIAGGDIKAGMFDGTFQLYGSQIQIFIGGRLEKCASLNAIYSAVPSGHYRDWLGMACMTASGYRPETESSALKTFRDIELDSGKRNRARNNERMASFSGMVPTIAEKMIQLATRGSRNN
ncbi:hypothetical protein [Litorivivens sp.]|uniref:hypothetical protein n=1 Tax=Litorivivens sp. TaxID=2020868 RepID=UPI00356A48A9